jgi:uncharacterized protein YjdB
MVFALKDAPTGSGIKVRAHVQNVGWQSEVIFTDATDINSLKKITGTTGQSLRMEAVELSLTGDIAKDYDIYYRAYVQGLGWLSWAANGQKAGSASKSLRMEGLEVKLVAKGSLPADIGIGSFSEPIITYSAHVQNIGWMSSVNDDSVAGTTGRSLRLEALKITKPSVQGLTGNIYYTACVTGKGWLSEVSGGQVAGTTGESRAIEAIKIRLDGTLADYYDVYYQLHTSNVGWMNWAKNGAMAGTYGFSKRAEAIRIVLVPKGANAPTGSGKAYVQGFAQDDFKYKGFGIFTKDSSGKAINVKKEFDYQQKGATLGLAGDDTFQLTSYTLEYTPTDSNKPTGGVKTTAHIQDIGWVATPATSGVAMSSPDGSKRIEAIRIELTGDLAKYYSVWYRVYTEGLGWLGWTNDGKNAGTAGMSKKIEAIQVGIYSIDAPPSMANGSLAAYYTEFTLPTQSGSGLALFNTSKKLSSGTEQNLRNAISAITGKGYSVGFVMMDLNTGAGIFYNSNGTFYSASSIKGPYVVSLVERNPSSVSSYSGVMTNTIKISSNESYYALRKAYGYSTFAPWLSEAGVTNVNPVTNYASITPAALARMWLKNYKFFTSGKQHSTWCRDLFTNTRNSFINQALGGKYTVYSKAGWINEGGYLTVQNDGSVVMANGHPYVLVILSGAYGKMSLLQNLSTALDAAHTELIK